MPKNLIDAALAEKPLEFNKAFNDAMTDRVARIVQNQKEFFAQNYFGYKDPPTETEVVPAPEAEVEGKPEEAPVEAEEEQIYEDKFKRYAMDPKGQAEARKAHAKNLAKREKEAKKNKKTEK